MDLFENHAQGDGGAELSEESTPAPEPTPEPAADTAEAQPSLDDALTSGGQATESNSGDSDGA